MDRTELKKRYISARRAVIGLDFTHLSDTQREAVMTTQGPLLLLAGAGSGKTTVLINRIANLLKYGCGADSEHIPDDAAEESLCILESYLENRIRNNAYNEEHANLQQLCTYDPIEPWRIIAITFTNKAAGEIKQRLEKVLGPKAEDIWASTFHSACARILRRDIDRLGYESSFTIYDKSDCASLMRRILKDMDVEERNLPYKTVLNYISRAKDDMISAGDFLSIAKKAGDIRKRTIGHAFLEYEQRMKASNALDFDDLILLTVRLFQENPDVLQYYQKKFKYVLIDEYQDTNNLQYQLAAALAGGYGNICVVGDDDQSIYKFRGATIENILNFEQRFKDACVIRLEQNYRSTGHILEAANDVICNNKGRKGKTLWTQSGAGRLPELHVTTDERAEAQFIADKIIASVADGQNWREHAVLYRMNVQSNQLETAFNRCGIPFRIVGGIGFYERAEIKDILAYLCIIHNPHDDVRLLRVINTPVRGIGNTTIDRIIELSVELGVPMYEVIKDSHNHETLNRAAGRLHLFADMIDTLRELSNTSPLDELYDAMLNRTGYIRSLKEQLTDINIARIENVLELKTNILSFMKQRGGTLFDFLSETALFTDMDRDDGSEDRVLMMTMHSAKGLEFDTVFVSGMEEGIFPGVRAIGNNDEIEEERRLCYVAMTRAMRTLYFTCTLQRMLFGKTSSAQASRFVREINSDHIEIHEPPTSISSFAFGNTGVYTGGFSYGDNSHTRKNRTHTDPDSQYTITKLPVGIKFVEGDAIEHTTFGRGVITSLSKAGGDALLEIAFDKEGTKRMLLKSAGRYMKKVDS